MPDRLRPAPAPEAIALKALSTRRRQLTELIAMEKTRLAQAFDAGLAASHRAVIAALEAACAGVERRLEAAIAADPALARRREILVSIPGIAGRIAGVVIADMPELDGPGSSCTEARIALMRRYLAHFPASTVRLLLGDREFIGAEWLGFLNDNNIAFAIRLREDCFAGGEPPVRPCGH
jgi:transposase